MKRKEKLEFLLKEIEDLLQYICEFEEQYSEKLEKVHDKYKDSARNLVHYIALRSRKINSLQKKLGNFGLSRLSESENHIMASIVTTRAILKSMLNETCEFPKHQLSFKKSRRLIRRNAKDLLGYRSKGRRTRIMVTLPSKAADDYDFVRNLIKKGMNCARINCAHDTSEDWQKMVGNVQRASRQLKRKCKISMDISGPKIRTGANIENAKEVKIQHQHDAFGKEIKPITVFFGTTQKGTDLPYIPLQDYDPKLLEEGNVLHFTDARFKKRKIEVCRITEDGFIGSLDKTTFFVTGLPITINENNKFIVGELAERKKPIYLRKNDFLIIKKDLVESRRAKLSAETGEVEPACISCTSPEIFSMVKIGESVLFDDGVIEGIIENVSPDEIKVKITHVPDKGGKLKPDKGINFPQSELSIASISEKDKQDLPFILEYANVINMSFVNHPSDVEDLFKIARSYKLKRRIGLILKIETRTSFDNLAEIILEGMRTYPIGVMIARGDLAVEIGWDKIGSIQEEILSVCKAAHITSIWATQVLENLAKKGIPSRAEITDTVMAQRADCIMLNKGSYILKAIQLLDTILKNMKKKGTALKLIQD